MKTNTVNFGNFTLKNVKFNARIRFNGTRTHALMFRKHTFYPLNYKPKLSQIFKNYIEIEGKDKIKNRFLKTYSTLAFE